MHVVGEGTKSESSHGTKSTTRSTNTMMNEIELETNCKQNTLLLEILSSSIQLANNNLSPVSLVATSGIHVFGVVSDGVNECRRGDLLGADTVDGSEERELVLHVLRSQHVVHLLGSAESLKSLSVQHLLLKLNNRLIGSDKCFGHFPVAATIAGGDKVGNTAALKEG